MQSNSNVRQTTERPADQRPQLLIAEVREGAEDAAYDFRAWAWGVHWRPVAIAICTAIIAYLQGDPTVLTASLTGLVILLIPQADRDVVSALMQTVLIKYRVIPQPPNESLFRPGRPTDPNHENLPRP